MQELIQEAVEAAGVIAELDQDIENELINLANNPQVAALAGQQPPPFPPLTGESVLVIEQPEHSAQLQEFASSIAQVATLFTTYNKCLRLIECSSEHDFGDWQKLTECIDIVAEHPRVSDKMKMRCFLINRDNVRTFRLLQDRFRVELDALFYMGKMNLLHISCDTGWANLARELVREGMQLSLRCPSLHMRPASLTPLMLAAGAGHIEVVSALLEAPSSLSSPSPVDTELRDSYGMTALFHTCNHGHHRVGDQHGYFRRLWSWDLSPTQLEAMEQVARDQALAIIKLLVIHGANLQERDKTGASLLTRAASVDNFGPVIEFLVEAGCRVTENVLNWVKVRNLGLANRVERELKVPGSLLRQSRAAVWRTVGQAGSREGFHGRLLQLQGGEDLPGVLGEYLLCQN